MTEYYPQLSDQEVQENIHLVEAGDLWAMARLTRDAMTHHRDNFELIRLRSDLMLRHIDKPDAGIFRNIARMKAHIGEYSQAFAIVDTLLEQGTLDAAYYIYKDLQNSTDPEIKGKAHYYLDKAAEGDYIYARKRKFALKVKWLGPTGMVLRWLHTAYLAPKYYTIIKENKHDPRMAGTREVAEEMFNRLSNKVKSLKFWTY